MKASSTVVMLLLSMCLKYLLMCLLVVELYHVDVLKCPTPDANPATGVSYEKKMESPLLSDSSVWLEPSCLRIILKCPLVILYYKAWIT